MRVIELLASKLDAEASEYLKTAPPNIFTMELDYWNLCLECKKVLIEERLAKEEKDAPNIVG